MVYRTLAITALLLAAQAPARASFDVPLVSPRTAALGGAWIPGEADASAVFTQPAAAASLSSPESYFAYQSLYAGLDGIAPMSLGHLSAAVPTKWGTIEVGLADFNASGLLDERTAAVGLARTVVPGVRVGVTGKLLQHSFMPDAAASQAPVFRNGTSASAFGVDAGLEADLSKVVRFQAAVRNINQPDVGLASEDRVPRDIQAGFALDLSSGLGLATGLSYLPGGPAANGQSWTPAVGVEKRLFGRAFALRLGANPNEWTAGMGLMIGRLGFDYSFALSRTLTQDNLGTHAIGLRLQFGGASSEVK